MSALIVVDYDPAWPQLFARLHACVWPAICDVATSLEHVGSTSVPGLAAKPVIDMTIIVPGEPELRTVIDRLAPLGYHHRGNLGVTGREAFTCPVDSPEHHLYACIAGAQGLRNHLAVRDYLRNHSDVTRQYGELKKSLAAQFPHDIDAYVDGKTELILKILAASNFSGDDLQQISNINRL
jgi:GrpB-like predicted nucleotidyltransferase (UPF0157 family)